jgi:hypothetical protein
MEFLQGKDRRGAGWREGMGMLPRKEKQRLKVEKLIHPPTLALPLTGKGTYERGIKRDYFSLPSREGLGLGINRPLHF